LVRKNEHSNYFITGGAGFIGSHLAEKLLNEGNRVTVYDNLVSGSKDNMKQLSGKDNFTFIEADLLDTSILNTAINGHDVVWHLGANTDIPKGNRVMTLT